MTRYLHINRMEETMTSKQENQGEGNRAADKEYRENTRDFVKSGQVQNAADKARDAVEGDEKQKLEKAEEAGKKPARS